MNLYLKGGTIFCVAYNYTEVTLPLPKRNLVSVSLILAYFALITLIQIFLLHFILQLNLLGWIMLLQQRFST